MSSYINAWIPNVSSWWEEKKPEPSAAAQFLHKHMYTIITIGCYYIAATRSPGITLISSVAGFSYQVYMAKETRLVGVQKLAIEIADEGETTQNDMYRHGVPLIIGTLIPPLQIITDTAVGFASGGVTARKVVKHIAPYVQHGFA